MARSDILPGTNQLGLTLDRYQEIMVLPIAAFNGLNWPEEMPHYQCQTIWEQRKLDYLAQYISQAEEMRVQELGYFLAPTYQEGIELEYDEPLIIPDKYLISLGKKKTTAIATKTLTLRTGGEIDDPIEFTQAVTFTDVGELKIFYPGEDVEIHPSYISITGGVATIKIPRSRLVDPSIDLNVEDHPQYDADSNFLTEVDIARVYYDNSEALTYVWLDNNGNEVTQTGRALIRNARTAIVDHTPASYTDNAWRRVEYSRGYNPYKIRVNFVSGRQSSSKIEKETARLAHALMPYKPIDCEAFSQYWQDDRNLHPSKTTTPYGNTNAAVNAWVADSRAKVGVGGMFI